MLAPAYFVYMIQSDDWMTLGYFEHTPTPLPWSVWDRGVDITDGDWTNKQHVGLKEEELANQGLSENRIYSLQLWPCDSDNDD